MSIRIGNRASNAPCVLLAAAGLLSGTALAAQVQVTVDGRAGPWDPVANFVNYPYGTFINGQFDTPSPATAVGKAQGISMQPGRQLVVTYISGAAGANADIFGDGGDGVRWWSPYQPPCTNAPGCYTHQVSYLEQLIGAFTDSAGVLVADPVILGSGPTKVIIPERAKLLLLGFNDDWHNDNVGSIVVDVKTDCTPDAEVTQFTSWEDDIGQPTYADFSMTMQPSNADFSGTEVREKNAAAAVDTCYFPGSKFKPWTRLSGGKWPVTDNSWGVDAIGWRPDRISYYRRMAKQGKTKLPCGVEMYQQMQIRCSPKDEWQDYGPVRVLRAVFDETTLQSERDGVASEPRRWP